MPWIDVDEPYAKPPRLPKIAPSVVFDPTTGDGWSGLDRGWGELSEVEVDADAMVDLTDCAELTITDSALSGVRLGLDGDGEPLRIEAFRSAFDGCDLSRARLTSLVNSRLTGCKLAGTDLSAATVTDVVFERCALSLTNLRMSKWKRVQLIDCKLDEVDAYRLEATDVAVSGSSIVDINADGLVAERFDLREAAELSFSVANSLSGCLMAEHQLAGLAHVLAFAAGVGVERFPDPDA